MDNPNNAWAYPPPQGYAPPPPPPPPKGLFAPPLGKNRGLALAMVCLMTLAQLAAVLAANLTDLNAGISGSLQLVLPAANLLFTLLVFLKCVLPGWEPHRKTLGWLLGIWALGSLAGSVGNIILGLRIAEEMLAGSSFGFAGIGGLIGGVFGALYGVAASPQGILLFGVIAKKSTEKIAALVCAVSCGLSLLSIPLLWLANRFLEWSAPMLDMPESLLPGNLLLSGTVLTSTIAGLVLSLCWAIFLFTWPVLDRAVMEKTS